MAGLLDEIRIRAAAVAVRDRDVLVVLRERDGRRYAVLPGGGVEPDETPQAACRREVREETGYDCVVEELLPVGVDRTSPAVYFRVRLTGGSLGLSADSPEAAAAAAPASNRYEPEWVPIDEVDRFGLVPDEAVRAVRLAASTAASS
jgi:8-oxo-dGTP diphosphatase